MSETPSRPGSTLWNTPYVKNVEQSVAHEVITIARKLSNNTDRSSNYIDNDRKDQMNA